MNAAPLRPRPTPHLTRRRTLVSPTSMMPATTTTQNINNTPTTTADSRTPTPPKPGQITVSSEPGQVQAVWRAALCAFAGEATTIAAGPRAANRGLGVPAVAAQSATCEPMITVRLPGRPKCSIGLAALRAIAMKSFLRHVFIPGAAVGVIVIRETK